MHVRFEPLNGLRRRARAVLRPVLPLLVVGWIGAAGPCVGMAAAPEGGAPARAEAREHASAHAHDGDHGAPAQAPRAAAPADTAPGHGHGACPHCPGSAGAPADAHARCAALDDVSDAKREPHAAKPDAKSVLPSVDIVGRAHDAPAAARRRALDDRVFPPSVRLNLRYCILIV